MGNKWTVREYLRTDVHLVSDWWKAHGEGQFPGNLIPPVGVVVERDNTPLAACWLYLAAGIGVCWLEFPVSKPGLTAKEAKDAFGFALRALEQIAKSHDYRLMIAHTLPPIARVMRSFGFRSESRKKITVAKAIR